MSLAANPGAPGIVLLGAGHAHLSALRHWRRGLPAVLVSRDDVGLYSARVPAVLRRELAEDAARIDVVAVASRVGISFVRAEIVGIDLPARRVVLADGRMLLFTWLSIDLGAATASRPLALPVRPAEHLLASIALIESQPARAVAVVGGGASGTELVLALAQRWEGMSRSLSLICSQGVLPGAPKPVRRRALQALADAGVSVRVARAWTQAGVLYAGAEPLPGHTAIWAAGVEPPALLEASGLGCAAGFVRVDSCLRSVSHPFVFVAGDAANLDRPKAGAWAVAAGPVLAGNLARVAAGRPARPWHLPATKLAAIGLGRGRGLAWRGENWLAGRPAWWLKTTLDARWMRAMGHGMRPP